MTLKTVPVCKTYNCWQSTQDFMLRLGASGLSLSIKSTALKSKVSLLLDPMK